MAISIKRFWKRVRNQPYTNKSYSTPERTRIYAIGDVHGCLIELRHLLDLIHRDLEGWCGHSEIIFLGDYVDRGPQSAGVIDLLSGTRLPGARQVFLAGNHEEAMLACLAGTGDVAQWLSYGGMQTLESYGLTMAELVKPDFDLKSWASECFPKHHRTFLERLEDSYLAGGYMFVHAGIRPGVAFHEQSSADFRWIRADFLDDERDHGAMVVHGHTISRQAEERPNRIGVDTGCYLSGRLSAVVLEGESRRFIDTRGPRRPHSI